jgi:chromate reductase, NAD(P)H dehydrogenase (quinone)
VGKKILCFSGSIRQGSFNTQLAHYAGTMLESLGARVTYLNLADYPLPLFNADWEQAQGVPDAARSLKQAMIDHDGFFIACPEYNSSITPLLKNSLDWASRQHQKHEPALQAFMDKAAAIGAASPGGFGGLRSLVALRLLLANVGVNVVGNQLAVAHAHQAFDAKGKLKEPVLGQLLQSMLQSLLRMCG